MFSRGKINIFVVTNDKCSVINVWRSDDSFFLSLFDFWLFLPCVNPPPSTPKTLLQIVHNALSGCLTFLILANCSSHLMEYEVLNFHIFFLLFNYVIKNKKLQTSFLPETPIISLIWAMEQYIPFWKKKKSQILILKVFMTFRILGFKKNKLNFRGF